MAALELVLTRRWSRLLRFAVAAGGGAMAAMGQAPFDKTWIALGGLLFLALALTRSQGRKQGFWTVWVGASAYFAIVLHWIVQPFQVDAATYGWMAPFALVFMAGGLALFWGIAGAVAGKVPGDGQRVLVFVLALSVLEATRGVAFTGFPWPMLAAIWIDTPAAIWLAWIGPQGLGLLTLLPLPAFFWAAHRKAVLAGFALVGPPLALVLTGLLAPDAPRIPPDAPKVRLVQPNAAQHLKWDPEWAPVFYQRQLDASRGPGAPDLTIWPESAIAAYLPRDAANLATISEAAGGRTVVMGINRSDGPRVYNSSVVLGAGGEITGRYDKAHLVPFGEYMPLGDLLGRFGLRGLAARDGNGFSSGPGPTLLQIGSLGKALPLICYEAIFPRFGRALSADADFMLHMTNDAWFGTFAGPQQHLALARMRAIERGLPVLRAANTGISAVIDARGTILAQIALGQAGYLDAPLPPRAAVTPYVRFGALPFLLIWALAAGVAGFARHRRIDAERRGK